MIRLICINFFTVGPGHSKKSLIFGVSENELDRFWTLPKVSTVIHNYDVLLLGQIIPHCFIRATNCDGSSVLLVFVFATNNLVIRFWLVTVNGCEIDRRQYRGLNTFDQKRLDGGAKGVHHLAHHHLYLSLSMYGALWRSFSVDWFLLSLFRQRLIETFNL